jgi:hypothetical protein
VIAILLLAAAAATAAPTVTLGPGNGTFGTTSCPTMSAMTFQQNGFCFFFPNGAGVPPDACNPTVCGQVNFNFLGTGTFTANLTYPSPNGFTLLGLQLCQNGAAVPDPATCAPAMTPTGGDVPGCTQDMLPGDNGTPLDPTDDTMTTTLTCPIAATGSYTLIVFPLAVLNCADVMDIMCAIDPTQGVTAALSGNFNSVLTSPGPEGASVEGGGEVAPHQPFSVHAQNDPRKWAHAHVRFAIAGNALMNCSFKADSATFVDVEPTPMTKHGGTALVQGRGTVTDAMKLKHDVNYTLRVSDGGKGGTDTFQLSAPGCDTNGLPVVVQHGNIEIHDNDH